jgi:hypothetical protein
MRLSHSDDHQYARMQHSHSEKSIAQRFTHSIVAFSRCAIADFAELLVSSSFFCFTWVVSMLLSIHWWKHEARSRADHVTEPLDPESNLIVDLSSSTSFKKSYHFQFTTIVLRACSLLIDWDSYHSRSKDESTLISLYSFSHRSEDENHSTAKKQTFETSNFATKRSIDSAK